MIGLVPLVIAPFARTSLICAVCPQGLGSDPEFLKGLKFHDANMDDAVQLVGPLEARPAEDAVQLVWALIAGGALSVTTKL